MGLSELATKLVEIFEVFPRYASYQKVALIAALPVLGYAVYLVTAGRPSAWELQMFPGSFGVGDDGYARVRLYLANNSGQREVHNIMGSFWIFGAEVAGQSAAPSSVMDLPGKRRSEYPINIALLPKSGGAELIEWKLVLPKPDETGAIGWNFVSSETKWQSGGVKIRNDGKGLRLEDVNKR